MTAQVKFRETAMLYALALGALADAIIRVQGRLGLNVGVWAVAGTAALWLLSRRYEGRVSRETWGLLGVAVAFAFLMALRDAEALAVFAAFGCIVLIGLAAGRAAHGWATRAGVVDVAVAAVRVVVLLLLGPLGWLLGPAPRPELLAHGSGRRWPVRARTLARGTVMALPLLLLLGALLMSADPVFARMVEDVLFADLAPVLEHVGFAALVAWFTSGYMRAFFVRDDIVSGSVRVPRPSLAPSELAVAVSLLVLLFAAFMLVQVRYLFGGAGLIEVTAGLSYAEYARRGFGELVAATALVVPVLFLADWAAAEDTAGQSVETTVESTVEGTVQHVAAGRRVLRATSLLLVLLLGGVLVSAAFRLRLYQLAYGLTEDRVYGTMFMVWLAIVLAWFSVTVLRGRREGFAFGAMVAGLACIAGLHLVNPHALIARVNIERAQAGAEVDARYLRTLSADAVPTLAARMDEIPEPERCQVQAMLVDRWAGPRVDGWRTWNLGDARARRLVAEMPAPHPCEQLPEA